MIEWLLSLGLGIVQGVTEFIPISSDGHLALLQILTSDPQSAGQSQGAEHLFFDVMLHLGTMVAILLCFHKQVKTSVRGLLGSQYVPDLYKRPALLRLCLMVFMATLPLVPDALFLKDKIDQTFQSLVAVGLGFLFTGLMLLVTMRLRGGHKGPAQMTWVDALIIGLAQALAPLPGVSRSGLTIAAGLMRGLSKSWTVGFSLTIAVPAILGATVFELKKTRLDTLGAERIAQIVAASALAGIVGYWAIVWLVRIVRSERLWYFSVYLFLLSALILGALVPLSKHDREPALRTKVVGRASAWSFHRSDLRVVRSIPIRQAALVGTVGRGTRSASPRHHEQS